MADKKRVTEELPSDWKLETVNDLLSDVIDYRGKTPPKSLSGIPILTAANISDGRIDLSNITFISPEMYDNWTTRGFVQPGDVLITTEAPVGQVAPLPGDQTYLITRRVIALRGKSGELDNRFLLYALMSPRAQQHLRSRSRGSTVPRVLKPDILGMVLPFPPFHEQQAIAQILGSLDDKIELNRRMNETLEAIARAIFKSWFVDFDPVYAKIEGRDPGLPRHIADLFPGQLVDSELGEIPEGWESRELGEIIELAYGKGLKESTRINGNIPVYGANGQIGWHNESLVDGPGIVVGRKGNPGTVTWVEGNFFPIDTTFFVIPIGEITSLRFLYFALQFHNLPFLASDSAVPGLNRNFTYMNFQCLPPKPLVDLFDELAETIAQRKESAAKESRTLSSIRDSLLPKLISGELRIEDPNRFLE